MKKLVIGLAVFLMVICVACGGGGGGNGGGSQSLTITGKSGNQVNLNGTWKGPCDSYDDDGSSEKSELTISGSSFSISNNFWYNSISCSGESDVTLTAGGSLTLGDEITVIMNGSDVAATEVNVEFDYTEATVNNATTAEYFNDHQVCSIDEWTVGVVEDVFGTSCSPDTNDKDVIYIDDTADPDICYVGDEDGPVDANGYPTEIDLDSAQERN